jgi:hypothetical protein
MPGEELKLVGKRIRLPTIIAASDSKECPGEAAWMDKRQLVLMLFSLNWLNLARTVFQPVNRLVHT